MAVVHVNVDLATIDIASLFFFAHHTETSTSFRVFDDDMNYVEFAGTGLGVVTDVNDNVIGVTGTITGVTFVEGGATQLDVSGASVSAPALFGLAVAGNTTGAIKLFLAGDDTIYGSGANDLLHGYDGSDKIFGMGGADRLFGDLGDDTLLGGGGSDKLFGGDGDDVLKGGPGNDILTGNAGDDILMGFGGNDIQRGGGGSDLLKGMGGDDVLKGEAGTDKILGGRGDDRILGNAGNDTLLGGIGRDNLLGGTGNDIIKGQAGSDFLTGNGGHDRFIFEDLSDSEPGAGHDHIVDFRQAQNDLINVHLLDADTLTGGNQDFSFIGTDPFSGTPGELRYAIQANHHTIIAANVDNDKKAEFTIELNTEVNLVGGDFFL